MEVAVGGGVEGAGVGEGDADAGSGGGDDGNVFLRFPVGGLDSGAEGFGHGLYLLCG